MALPATALASENAEEIRATLAGQERMDSTLARVLFESYQSGYYRLLGFRSLKDFLAERFKGTDVEDQARMCARTHSRLIREYKLALEIPEFQAVFDRIKRVNRRLIAQVLTRANATLWIERALTLTTRELEALVQAAGSTEGQPFEAKVTRTLKLFPGQLDILNQAIAVAARMMANDKVEPREHMCVEQIAAEFLATYGAGEVLPHIECPGCCQRVQLMKALGSFDEDPRTRVFVCGNCEALVVMRAVGGEPDVEIPSGE